MLAITVFGLVGLYTAAVLVVGKRLSSRAASKFIPIVMHGVDQNFRPARNELLRDLRGSDVLDLGCGHGPYFKYVAAAGAKSILAVEPNVHLHRKIKRTMAKVNIPVELSADFVENIPGKHRFDWVILGNGMRLKEM